MLYVFQVNVNVTTTLMATTAKNVQGVSMGMPYMELLMIVSPALVQKVARVIWYQANQKVQKTQFVPSVQREEGVRFFTVTLNKQL